jgi:hypothetical protein
MQEYVEINTKVQQNTYINCIRIGIHASSSFVHIVDPKLSTKRTLSAICGKEKTINMNIAEVRAKSVVVYNTNDVKFKFARIWYCQDICCSSMLQLAIEKSMKKSPHYHLSRNLFDIESNQEQNQCRVCVFTHKGQCCDIIPH